MRHRGRDAPSRGGCTDFRRPIYSKFHNVQVPSEYSLLCVLAWYLPYLHMRKASVPYFMSALDWRNNFSRKRLSSTEMPKHVDNLHNRRFQVTKHTSHMSLGIFVVCNLDKFYKAMGTQNLIRSRR